MSDTASRPHPAPTVKPFAREDVPSALSAGIVIGILSVFLQVSFASMLFSGQLDVYIAEGIGMLIFGAMIVSLIAALTSTYFSSIAIPQDTPVAVLSVILASIAATLAASPNEDQIFGTVIATIMIASLLSGLTFWLMGQFDLGKLIRFIPYPVIGGFLAGTGWLLVTGSIGVMVDVPFGLAIFEPAALIRWLPGALLAVLLHVLIRRFSHFLLLPSVLIGAIVLFYLVYFLANGEVTSAETTGWLVGPFPAGRMWNPGILISVTQANFGLIASNAVNLGSLVLIAAITFLLNLSGIELATKGSLNINKDLKSLGLGNILASLVGSTPGFHALSLSMLGHRLGTNSRFVGIFTASVLAVALLFGAQVISFFPRMVAGGFLFFIALSFLIEWVIEAYFKLPKLDYALLWLILIVIATVGFLEGVAVGILVAALLFVVNYSRTQVVRHTLTGTDLQSEIMRPRLYEQLLVHRGEAIALLELQGYIFFGTAYRLVEQIEARLQDDTRPPLRYLLLDFRLVTGFDTSAALSATRLLQMLEGQQLVLVLTGLSAELGAQFEQMVLPEASQDAVRVFSSLDRGLAWCESQIIRVYADVGLAARPKTLLAAVNELLPSAETPDYLQQLNPLSKPTGSPNEARLMAFLQLRTAETGEALLAPDQGENGLFFVESGRVMLTTNSAETRVLEPGTLFAAGAVYTEQAKTISAEALEPAAVHFLSSDALSRMEREDPELAIAIHRLTAATLQERLLRMDQAVQALRS